MSFLKFTPIFKERKMRPESSVLDVSRDI